MNLIEEIEQNSEVVVSCNNLNEIIENDKINDWIQIPDNSKRFINVKLNERNYCTLIILDIDEKININAYLSSVSLEKENGFILQ